MNGYDLFAPVTGAFCYMLTNKYCILYRMTLLWIGVLIVSLIVLVKSADYFTEYSSRLGLLFGLSSFIIGATIVAIGTSLPELVSSLFAVHARETSFVVDNIIGSNVANALLILGVGAVFARTLKVKTSLIDVDLPFFFSSMALFVFFALDGTISWVEGLFLFGFFIIFLIYSIRQPVSGVDKEEMEALKEQFNHTKRKSKQQKIFAYLGIIIVSAGLISLSAKFLIDSILHLSEIFGIATSFLTITVVALGTSLPEVLTSIAAIKKGNHAVAIGNVFGSNTFNLLLVGGIPSFVSNLSISKESLLLGLPFLVIATFAAIFVTFDNKVRTWEGVSLLFLYVVFIAKITGLI